MTNYDRFVSFVLEAVFLNDKAALYILQVLKLERLKAAPRVKSFCFRGKPRERFTISVEQISSFSTEAIVSSRNFLHASQQLLMLGVALKNVPSEKGNIAISSIHHKHLHSMHCACLLPTSPHTHQLHTDIH